MKIKRLSALLLLLCLVFCACQSRPPADTTEEPTQTVYSETTITPDTTEEPPAVEQTTSAGTENIPQTVDCLYEFFMDDANLNKMPKSEETVSPEDKVYGWDDPSTVPQTDRSDLYGTTYRIRLTADVDTHRFCFRYDVIEKQLDVIIIEAFSPLLLIFQVDGADDWEEFVRIVEEDQYLSATLVHARNIDYGRTLTVQAAFSWLEGIPFETTDQTPYMRYIMGYALHDSTGMIASNKHDTIDRMDYIISLYGEDPS